MPDVLLEDLRDDVARGREPLDAESVELLVEVASVEPLALDLEDHRHRLADEVDASDPCAVITDIDLTTKRREPRGPQDLHDPGLETRGGRDVVARSLSQDLAHDPYAGTAALREVIEHGAEGRAADEPHRPGAVDHARHPFDPPGQLRAPSPCPRDLEQRPCRHDHWHSLQHDDVVLRQEDGLVPARDALGALDVTASTDHLPRLQHVAGDPPPRSCGGRAQASAGPGFQRCQHGLLGAARR